MSRNNNSTELIQKFKKANKQAREKIAAKHGFKSADEYLNSLVKPSTTKKTSKLVTKTSKNKIDTVKNIIIVDNSGSMMGSKIHAAVLGVMEELAMYKKEKSKLNILHTIISFSRVHTVHVKEAPIDKITYVPNWRGTHSTNLYGTIVVVLSELLENLKPNERALVKIFTDGGDTDSSFETTIKAADLIKQAEQTRTTVTFVGTENDVKNVVNVLKIQASNTLVHNNTAEDVKRAFSTTTVSTSTYLSSVAKGASEETLIKGFYKKQGKL
jgi:hypothetical protein